MEYFGEQPNIIAYSISGVVAAEKQKNNMPSGESEKVDELNEKLDVFARDLKHGYKIS